MASAGVMGQIGRILDRKQGPRHHRQGGTLGRLVLACLLLTASVRVALAADDLHYFRIGTAAISGTYFTVGGLIAGALSNPPGSRDCARGGNCGVPNLIATAEATEGSVDNVQKIAAGQLDSGLCQADVALWALKGNPPFQTAHPELRAIAALYAETIHIVALADGPVHSLTDLAGKRVSVGERESGTLADTIPIIEAAGLALDRIHPVYEKVSAAVDDLAHDRIDAFFIVAGAPVPAITDLANTTPLRLIPIEGDVRAKLRERMPFFQNSTIAADSYPGQTSEVQTLGVKALWVVPSTVDEELVFALTRALWNANTLKGIAAGSPIGREIRRADALQGISIPLHPGAERFYQSAGTETPRSR